MAKSVEHEASSVVHRVSLYDSDSDSDSRADALSPKTGELCGVMSSQRGMAPDVGNHNAAPPGEQTPPSTPLSLAATPTRRSPHTLNPPGGGSTSTPIKEEPPAGSPPDAGPRGRAGSLPGEGSWAWQQSADDRRLLDRSYSADLLLPGEGGPKKSQKASDAASCVANSPESGVSEDKNPAMGSGEGSIDASSPKEQKPDLSMADYDSSFDTSYPDDQQNSSQGYDEQQSFDSSFSRSHRSPFHDPRFGGRSLSFSAAFHRMELEREMRRKAAGPSGQGAGSKAAEEDQSPYNFSFREETSPFSLPSMVGSSPLDFLTPRPLPPGSSPGSRDPQTGESTPTKGSQGEERKAALSYNGRMSHGQGSPPRGLPPYMGGRASPGEKYLTPFSVGGSPMGGYLGGSLPSPSTSQASYLSFPPMQSPFQQRSGDASLPMPPSSQPGGGGSMTTNPDGSHRFFCHLCSYRVSGDGTLDRPGEHMWCPHWQRPPPPRPGPSKQEFDKHMELHFEYRCPQCDYTSRTEGRLKRHIKDFHTNNESEAAGGKERVVGRPKQYKCKQCDFVCIHKHDFWDHQRTHIKEDKMLQCPRCPFVTEYKHHLEYHLRNHFGSKPFKCTKCNYSCVNKSMLNSHMKSHTNVYQYRCSDCTYATKYCHSLKLHLKKYNHKPAAVLNSDGSLPQGVEADKSGLNLLAKRGPPRGPRGPRKEKGSEPSFSFGPFSNMPTPSGMPGMGPTMIPPFWPIPLGNGMQPPPPLIPVGGMPGLTGLPHPPSATATSTTATTSGGEGGSRPRMSTGAGSSGPCSEGDFPCRVCAFLADSAESLSKHMTKVHMSDYRDLFQSFGVSSEEFEESSRAAFLPGVARRPSAELKWMPNGVGPPTPSTRHPQGDMEPPRTTSPTSPWPTPLALTSMGARYPPTSHGGPMARGEETLGGQDGADILKEMTRKFGLSGPAPPRKEGPLDLTKPKSASPPTPATPSSSLHSNPLPCLMPAFGYSGTGMHSTSGFPGMRPGLGAPWSSAAESEPSSGDNSQPGATSPQRGPLSPQQGAPSPQPQRRRSRKGKAYKLETLCSRLADRQAPNYDSDTEEDMAMGGEGDDSPPAPNPPMDVDDAKEEGSSQGVEATGAGDRAAGSQSQPGSEEDLYQGSLQPQLDQIHRDLRILNSEMPPADATVAPSLGEGGLTPTSNPTSNPFPPGASPARSPPREGVSSPRGQGPVLKVRPLPLALLRGQEVARRIMCDEASAPVAPFPPAPPGKGQANGDTRESSPPNGVVVPRPPPAGPPVLPPAALGTTPPSSGRSRNGPAYECPHCDIEFRDYLMYTVHMGYHGFNNPFKCNKCGYQSKNSVEFFIHLTREPHP